MNISLHHCVDEVPVGVVTSNLYTEAGGLGDLSPGLLAQFPKQVSLFLTKSSLSSPSLVLEIVCVCMCACMSVRVHVCVCVLMHMGGSQRTTLGIQ